jgi:hypothetical protein
MNNSTDNDNDLRSFGFWASNLRVPPKVTTLKTLIKLIAGKLSNNWWDLILKVTIPSCKHLSVSNHKGY